MKKLLLILACAVGLSTSLSSCAGVLTSSQVEEVKKFAQASEDYSAIPGSLATSYATLLRNERLLSVCRYHFGVDTGAGIDTRNSNEAWKNLQEAYGAEHEFKAAGKKMDAALGVLKGYSKVLALLASDKYTDTLGNSAVDLGKSIDSATDAYNTKYRAANPLSKVGGEVGQIIRAAGGIYIKHRQAEILKETVAKWDPVIHDLMADVEDVAVNRFKPDFTNYEENFLHPTFLSVANNNHKMDLSLATAFYDDLEQARAGVILCDQVASAARAYAAAHHALVEKTRSRIHLKEAIEEVKALSKEVKSASSTKKEINK